MTTLTDVSLSSTSWTNVHTTRSLTSGTAVTVQSKTNIGVLLYVNVTAPTDNSGFLIRPDDNAAHEIVLGGSEYLFAKCVRDSATLCVEI